MLYSCVMRLISWTESWWPLLDVKCHSLQHMHSQCEYWEFIVEQFGKKKFQWNTHIITILWDFTLNWNKIHEKENFSWIYNSWARQSGAFWWKLYYNALIHRQLNESQTFTLQWNDIDPSARTFRKTLIKAFHKIHFCWRLLLCQQETLVYPLCFVW